MLLGLTTYNLQPTTNLFPVLFAFGPIVITTLGIMASLSFLFGGFVIWRKAKEEHIEDSDIFDLIFISLLVGLIGGRVGYVLSNYSEFGFTISRWLDPVTSHGFAWFGFLIGWMVGLKLVCDHKKWSFFEMADISVLGIILSQILVRIGQFFDGSYVGSQTDLPTGLVFQGFDNPSHPLSLYELPLLFMILFLVRYFDKYYRLYKWYRGPRGEARPGFLWLSYLLMLGITHVFLDFAFVRYPVLVLISYRQLWLMGWVLVVGGVFWLRSGSEFDVWKLRERWFGNTPKTVPAPAPVNPSVLETSTGKPDRAQTTDLPRRDDTPVSAPESVSGPVSSGVNVGTGRRFFRSRK